MAEPTVLYSRTLPGGGYVAVESGTETEGTHRGWIAVERRTDPVRRMGHTPPVIAEIVEMSPQRILQALYEIAADNVAVAKGLLRWESRRKGNG